MIGVNLVGDVAIDLGSSNTLIYRQGRGVVLSEPSVVTVRRDTPEGMALVAAGEEALRMIGRTTAPFEVCRPVREGVIAEIEAAVLMLQGLVVKAFGPRPRFRRILISMPCGVSDVERRAFAAAAERLGAREVLTTVEPLAAAIGAGMDVLVSRGQMLVDVGSGITEAVVISMGSVAAYHSIRRGGTGLDDKIVEYIRRTKKLNISRAMAEQLKFDIGEAALAGAEKSYAVKGKLVSSRLPAIAQVEASELRPLILSMVDLVAECVLTTLDKTTAELVTDICDAGVVLSGGGLLVKGFEDHLSKRLGLPVIVTENPLQNVALGNGMLLGARGSHPAISAAP